MTADANGLHRALRTPRRLRGVNLPRRPRDRTVASTRKRSRSAAARRLWYGAAGSMAAASEILTLIRACAAGNATARRSFQDRYGPDIYNFPVKIYRAPADRAADFYLYAFERDRIFKRLTTFEGRNSIQFRTFLGHYVLRSLFIEWQRSQHDLDAVSLSSPVGDPNDGRVLEDVLADPDSTEVPAEDGGVLAPLWTRLSPDDQLDLKLLSLL